MQNTHARAYRALSDTVQVTALADVVPENLQKIGELFSVPTENRYMDYREMLEHAAIDVVTIATPHSLHAEQVIEAATAGVAIISENRWRRRWKRQIVFSQLSIVTACLIRWYITTSSRRA